MDRAPFPEATERPVELPARCLLVAAGGEGDEWAAAAQAGGLAVRIARAEALSAVREALRDPQDLAVAWDDAAGERAGAVVAAVREAGSTVPVAVIAHPEAEDALPAAFAAGAIAALDRGRADRLAPELHRVLREERLRTRAALTGRLAHDLNNLLAPIPLAVQLLRRNSEGVAGAGPLGSIETATRRSMGVVKELSELVSGDVEAPLRVPAKHLLAIAARRWRPFRRGVSGTLTDYPPDLGPVRVDPVRILQVLWCLARRAVDDTGGGELLFRGRTGEDTPLPGVELRVACVASGGAEPAAMTGGRPPEPADRLDAIQEIVAAHGGTLQVLEGDAGWSGFLLRLPSTVRVAGSSIRTSPPSPPSRPDPAEPPSGGSPRGASPDGPLRSVLVIDGDGEVRRMTRETLESFGFEVYTAGDGSEGVALFAAHLDEVGAVLVDTALPHLDGLSTIRALRRVGERARIILTSAGERDLRRVENAPDGPDEVLHKPYDADSLLAALRPPG